MKITDQDIISTAQRLRDEENEQLLVPPVFNRAKTRHHIPAWLVAIPAAAFIGFLLGVWTNGHRQDNTPLTAIADTVYIKVKEPSAAPDTTTHTPPQQAPATPKPPTVRNVRHASPGRPVAEDKIRYDLLVMN